VKNLWASCVCIAFFGVVYATLPTDTAHAQESITEGVSANSLLRQLAAVFSSGRLVQSVQLTGNATWFAGSLEDSGTVNLTASTNGSSEMQLQLASTGQRTESQTGTALSADCQWAGADGVPHEISLSSCLRPDLWFLPAFSLQPSLLPSYVTSVDLGVGAVGSDGNSLRRLQNQLVISNFSSQAGTNLEQQSTTNLGLDPTTLLPAVLAYTVNPDNGAQAQIAIEIRYSNYQTVSGVQVPFHIQRYVNGSLQLDIVISSAQID
jgi:hypothetical protein